MPSIEKWINQMVNTVHGWFSALLEIHSVNSSILERQTENYIPEGINDPATFVEHKPWRVARKDVLVCCVRNLILTDFGLLRSKYNLITISITSPAEVIEATSTDSSNFHQETQCITGWPHFMASFTFTKYFRW